MNHVSVNSSSNTDNILMGRRENNEQVYFKQWVIDNYIADFGLVCVTGQDYP